MYRKSLLSLLLCFCGAGMAFAQFLSGDTIFVSDSIVSLSGVTVTARKDVIRKADKVIYKVDPGDFIKHSRAENILRRIPNVAVTPSGILLDNRKNAVVYIDGIESTPEELKRLHVEDIESVEVIDNPSAIYGSELTGGVIHVVRRKKEECFLMGELEASRSVRLNLYGFTPSLSFKKDKVMIDAFYSFNKNNQDIHSSMDRIWDKKHYEQDYDQETQGWQGYGLIRARMDFDLSNRLILSGSATHYGFDHYYDGTLRSDTGRMSFDYRNREWVGKYTADVLFRHSFSKNAHLDLKARYFDYSAEYESQARKYSKIREGSGEVLFLGKTDLWESPLELTAGYKHIYRRYLTGERHDWLASQMVNSLHTSASYSAGNVSGYVSLSYDYTHQSLEGQTFDYHSFLPVVALLYRNSSLADVRLNYARKITRPSVDYLNPEKEVYNPLYVRVGNTRLDLQENNELSARIGKAIAQRHELSLNAYYLFNNKVIGEVLREEKNQTFYSYDNIGRMRVYGLNVGWSASLPYDLYLNAQAGPVHREYASPDARSLVRENGGWSFAGYLNAGMTLKGFLSVNLDWSYDSRLYQLVSTMRMKPMVNLDIEANLCGDRLKIELYCQDLGGWFGTSRSFSRGDSFEQHVVTENKMMNFTFSVRYLFGKRFDNRMGGEAIDNSDIITK